MQASMTAYFHVSEGSLWSGQVSRRLAANMGSRIGKLTEQGCGEHGYARYFSHIDTQLIASAPAGANSQTS